MLKPELAQIFIYPVKSFRGISVDGADVEPWGLRHDRRWLVLKPDGTVLTARRERRMLGMTAAPIDDSAIRLTASDGSALSVEVPFEAAPVPVTLSRLESVRPADAKTNEWLSGQLHQPVRLAWLDDPRRRSVSLNHGGRTGDSLNLSDAGPLLLTTRTSLGQLNAWLDGSVDGSGANREIDMRQFRPNVVIDGTAEPFAEDSWNRFSIGPVDFRLAEQCDRCVMTTIDPETLAGGKEPLRTLARHRQWSHKTWFGIRVVPVNTATVHVGDAVEID